MTWGQHLSGHERERWFRSSSGTILNFLLQILLKLFVVVCGVEPHNKMNTFDAADVATAKESLT